MSRHASAPRPIRARLAAALCGFAAAASAFAAASAAIPERPEKLTFGDLKFEVPDASKLRSTLPGGVVVYVVEDHSLPLVKLTLTFRTGAFREPAGKTGLADLTASMMREGGTAKMTPEEFDQRADFLAANLGAGAGPTAANASLDVLSSGLDEGLGLLFDMVKSPRFDEARLEVERGKIREALKQRNDDAGDIQAREWSWLMNGETHFSSRQMTVADLDAIRRQDLIDFHRATFGPEHLIVAVSGDVDAKSILAKLGQRLAGWRAGEPNPVWPPKGPDFRPKPGLFHVEKDIPQGKVTLGHLGIQWRDWNDPKNYALMVMNDILGGGGFTSRITKRVRSDEGLAYGAGSAYRIGNFWPGTFTIGYASKSPTVALAGKIALEEVAKMQAGPVSDEELRIAKGSFIESFPRGFESAAKIAGTFSSDELLGRPHDYWTKYRDRIRAVTAADVQAAAREFLHPDRLTMLVVGKWSDIAPGDAAGRASMKDLFGGQVTHLPPRDPLTLAPQTP
jgi:predicted Zn-dependent peptidase